MYGENSFVPYYGLQSSGCSEAAPSSLRPPHQSCDNCLLLRWCLQFLRMQVLVVALVASTTGISHVEDERWEERELAQEEECRQEEVSPCQQEVESVP